MKKTTKSKKSNLLLIKWLTFLMFMMFAMTTDAVGEIIKEVIKQFDINMTEAGLLHYGPMIAIALSAILLGFLADKFGRKRTVILGLTLFALNSYLFIVGNSFAFFLCLLIISGFSIGIFKTGALALIGDITASIKEHTTTMNLVEGFFGIGAILGTFLVSYFLSQKLPWKWLYIIAATLAVILIIVASFVRFPDSKVVSQEPINLKRTLKMMKNPYALGFSIAAFLYVSVEAGVYVWMPTLFGKYHGSLALIATYSLTIFFILRALGRFLGAWIMKFLNWYIALTVFSSAIFLCFIGSILGGISLSIILLPLSGLFMSVLYPTINSKGISCFHKSEHGAISGVILFFTAAGAALGPLAMGAVSDAFHENAKYGFILATFFAGLLLILSIYNLILKPSKQRLEQLNKTDY